MMPGDLSFPPIEIDVGSLVQRSVATLYSHLVTRPTGRAVRQAIESLLDDAGDTAFSLIDLSEVTVLDFSCADEVVAKLLLRYSADAGHEAFFVFRGVREPHREPIVAVLERHGLAAVAETGPRRFELLGEGTEPEHRAWAVLEDRGRLEAPELPALLPSEEQRRALDALAERRVAFRSPGTGGFHALSRLVLHLL